MQVNTSVLRFISCRKSSLGCCEFKIISNSYDEPLAISVEDIDGVENGVFQPEIMWLDVNEAEQTEKPSGAWYEGAYTFTVNVELTEAEGGAEIQ